MPVFWHSAQKEAVSGTTLADIPSDKGKSYVSRLEDYLAKEDKAESLDGFILRLSTNDIRLTNGWGEVSEDSMVDVADFNRATTLGTTETIIAEVKAAYDCPINIYTNSYYNSVYGNLVAKFQPLVSKWGIALLNLHDDEEFNAISEEQKNIYMNDGVHPSRAGYRDWWLPKFEEMLGFEAY